MKPVTDPQHGGRRRGGGGTTTTTTVERFQVVNRKAPKPLASVHPHYLEGVQQQQQQHNGFVLRQGNLTPRRTTKRGDNNNNNNTFFRRCFARQSPCLGIHPPPRPARGTRCEVQARAAWDRHCALPGACLGHAPRSRAEALPIQSAELLALRAMLIVLPGGIAGIAYKLVPTRCAVTPKPREWRRAGLEEAANLATPQLSHQG